MAWSIVSQELAMHYCNADDTVLRDDYSEIIEGIIFERYKYLIGQDTFTETLDGTGTNLLQLTHTPIISITSTNILSPVADENPVYDISNNILVRGGYIRRSNGVFPEGFANVRITYIGGTDTIDPRLQLAELSALAYLVKFFTANRGGDSNKFASAGAIGQNQYTPSPGIVTKILKIMDDLVPKRLMFR